MKTTIITTVVAVGMLLRPQPILTTENGAIPGGRVAVGAVQQTGGHALTAAEMNTAVGGDATGCYETQMENGDTYVTCCLDLWIFVVCFGVNVSALGRLVPFL